MSVSVLHIIISIDPVFHCLSKEKNQEDKGRKRENCRQTAERKSKSIEGKRKKQQQKDTRNNINASYGLDLLN